MQRHRDDHGRRDSDSIPSRDSKTIIIRRDGAGRFVSISAYPGDPIPTPLKRTNKPKKEK